MVAIGSNIVFFSRYDSVFPHVHRPHYEFQNLSMTKNIWPFSFVLHIESVFSSTPLYLPHSFPIYNIKCFCLVFVHVIYSHQFHLYLRFICRRRCSGSKETPSVYIKCSRDIHFCHLRMERSCLRRAHTVYSRPEPDAYASQLRMLETGRETRNEEEKKMVARFDRANYSIRNG